MQPLSPEAYAPYRNPRDYIRPNGITVRTMMLAKTKARAAAVRLSARASL